MNKVKVSIIKSESPHFWYADLIGTTLEVTEDSCYYFAVDRSMADGNSLRKDDCELAWQPEPGEMIEVMGGFDWTERKFVAMDGDRYICRNVADISEYCGWDNGRPIKKTRTITLEDGTTVELSEESYKALKEGVS